MSNLKTFLCASYALGALLLATIPTLAFADTCDQVCATADEPGFNKATDGANQLICCCQMDSGSQTLVNHPESECAGVNPQATSTPSQS